MNLRALEAFCAVYREGSFTAAAARLGLSQPTVSSHVRNLEEELGASLFDRVGRRVQPTRAARLLFRHARRLLDASREMNEELDRFLHGLHGRLVAAASTIPGEYWLPSRIGRFHELYPEIAVTVEIRDSGAVVERVLDGRAELGVVGARLERDELVFRELAVDRLVLVAPPGQVWLTGRSVSLDALCQLPFVLREEGSGTRLMFERALAHRGLAPELHAVAELGSTTAVKEAVKAGVGVSVLSRLAVEDDLAAGRVQLLEMTDLPRLERAFFAVTHRSRAVSPLARAFLEFLHGSLDG